MKTETRIQSPRLTKIFREGEKKQLSIYVTAGFPEINSLTEIVPALERSGIQLIEIGIPFSDPLADGPIIQDASAIAIRNGMNMKLLFTQIEEIRKKSSAAIVLMGYLNSVLQFGLEKFCSESKRCGIDAVIIPDLPVGEYEREYSEYFLNYELPLIFLVTPQTTESRIRLMDELGNGFLYLVSTPSVTGKNLSISAERDAYLDRIAEMNLRLPRLVGFGIHDRESFLHVTKKHHGAIIGTAFLRAIAAAKNSGEATEQFISSIKNS